MNMQSVLSSSIAAIGYDKETETLRVQFNSHAIYEYAGVPERVWEEFLDSKSKGSFFLTEIKPNYASMCIKERVLKTKEEADAEEAEAKGEKKAPKRTVGVKRIS